MIKNYQRGRYEFFIVIAVIAILMAIAFGRYQTLAVSAHHLHVEMMSHHFMQGAADARVQWLLRSSASPNAQHPGGPYAIAGQDFYFSPDAWPVSTQGVVSENFQPTVEDCYRLWMALLKNPPPISRAGIEEVGSRPFHVAALGKACRYQSFGNKKNKIPHFDYFPLEGRIILFLPNQDIPKN